MKRFEGIIESTTPPASKNVLWIDRGVPKYHRNGKWETLGAGNINISWNDISDKPEEYNPKVLRIPEDKFKGGVTLANNEFEEWVSKIKSGYLVVLEEYNKDGSTSNITPLEATVTSNDSRIRLECVKSNTVSNAFYAAVTTQVIYDKSGESVYNSGSFSAQRTPYNSGVYLNGRGEWVKLPSGTSVPDTDTSEAATIQTVAATLNSLLASLRASGAIQS